MKPGFRAICYLVLGAVVFLRCFALSATTAKAAVETGPIIFSDDFSQDFTKWQAVRNARMWKLIDGQAEAYVPGGSTITEMVPKDEFWASTNQNIEYSLDYTPLEGIDKNISFGFQDLKNWYEIHFVETFYNLVRLDNGQAFFSLLDPYVMTNGQTYHLTIRFFEGNIQVTIDGQLVADETDWSFNHNYGKIGIKAGTGAVAPTRVRFDNVVVRSLTEAAPAPTEITFKQTDDRWATALYDHADKWSTSPTIRRWGCALTSMAMVLRHHGLNLLPDGAELTPLSLNNWLLTQPDGFIGEGNLNWLAVTRLTRLISDRYQTPKLEFKRFTGPSLAAARQALSQAQPVIFQIPGHFFVGSELTNDDIKILDPAYSVTMLSQHHQSLLSTNTFTPSFTDLSYLAFVRQPSLQLRIWNSAGQDITPESSDDQLNDQLDGTTEKSPLWFWQLLPQPTSGTYTIELSQPKLAPFQMTFLAYDQAGNVTSKNETGVVGSTPIRWQITFSKTGPSQISSQVTLSDIRAQLVWLWKTNQIKHRAFYLLIDHLMSHCYRLPKHHWLLKRTLTTLIQRSRKEFTPAAQQLLMQELAKLPD